MHGENLVIRLVGQKLIARKGELGTYQHCQQPTDQEENPTGHHEAQTHRGMIDDGQRTPAARVVPDFLKPLVQSACLGGQGRILDIIHGCSVSSQAPISSRVSVSI